MTTDSRPFQAISAALKELNRLRAQQQPEPRSTPRSRPLRAESKPTRHALKPPMRRADMRELVRDLRLLDVPQRHDVESSDAIDADDVAAMVIAAAELRDVGGPPLPKLDGVAAMVIDAGRKRRRGEV